MKITLSLTTILCTVTVLSFQTNLTSCTKETITVHDTTIVHDTVPPTPLTNTQMLTRAGGWKVDEVWTDRAGVTTHYKRGGENTTGVNYDIIRLVFNANGTGSTVDVSGTTYGLTWEYTTNDEQNMRIVVNGIVTYDWVLVDIAESFILQSSPQPNGDFLSARWIPVE